MKNDDKNYVGIRICLQFTLKDIALKLIIENEYRVGNLSI